ncbi:MAG TPA: hypothetical protein DCG34_03900 [Clostridiales bacterium]|jgi:hypothetical protein|nr:hypothetical protein [Clostridiales bacterium]
MTVKIDNKKKTLLAIFVGTIALELMSSATVAQVPIVGDFVNVLSDGVLNTVQLLIATHFATSK